MSAFLIESVSIGQYIVIVAAWFCGFFIRGAFGFGSNLPIILITTWILGPHHAVIITLLGSFAVQIYLFPQGVKGADWKIVRPIFLGLAFGIVIGTTIFAKLDGSWLTVIMGILIIGILLGEKFSVVDILSTKVNLRSKATVLSLSVTSGFIGSVSGGGGMYFLVPYLKYILKTPQRLRDTNLALGGLFMIARITGVAVAGFVAWQLILQAAFLLPAAFLGAWAGSRFYNNASTSKFFSALTVLLLTLAIATTIRGLLATGVLQ